MKIYVVIAESIDNVGSTPVYTKTTLGVYESENLSKVRIDSELTKTSNYYNYMIEEFILNE